MPITLVRFTKRAEKTRVVLHSMRLRPSLMALIATGARQGTTVLDLEDSISMALVGGCGMKVIIMWVLGSLRTRGAACGLSRRTILGDAAAVTALGTADRRTTSLRCRVLRIIVKVPGFEDFTNLIGVMGMLGGKGLMTELITVFRSPIVTGPWLYIGFKVHLCARPADCDLPNLARCQIPLRRELMIVYARRMPRSRTGYLRLKGTRSRTRSWRVRSASDALKPLPSEISLTNGDGCVGSRGLRPLVAHMESPPR